MGRSKKRQRCQTASAQHLITMRLSGIARAQVAAKNIGHFLTLCNCTGSAGATASASDLLLLPSQLPSLEGLAHCVENNLPALVVGGTASGKTSIVQTLATLCGQPIVQIALNGSSDTSDLLGGFEQASMGHRLQVCFVLLFSSYSF